MPKNLRVAAERTFSLRDMINSSFDEVRALADAGFTGFIELGALLWWGIELWHTMNVAPKGRPTSMPVSFPVPVR
jgi:hypothetical protein